MSGAGQTNPVGSIPSGTKDIQMLKIAVLLVIVGGMLNLVDSYNHLFVKRDTQR